MRSCFLLFIVFITVGSSQAQYLSPATFSAGKLAIGDTVPAIDTCIWYILQDKQNNHWFCSYGQGVYRYDGKHIVHYSQRDGLVDHHLRGIEEDKAGNIYFNTDRGISRFDGKTFTTLKPVNGTGVNGGWRLHPDDLWFRGIQDSGVLYRYDGTTLHRLRLPKVKAAEEFRAEHPHIGFNPYDVYSIYKDKSGNLWFGVELLGACCYDGKTFAWMSEKELGLDAISINLRSTIEDRNGDFWFSNTMHRFKISNTGHSSGKVSYIQKPGVGIVRGLNPADYAYFMSAVTDSRGDLWMVTYDKGVWRYDGTRLTHYDIKDGKKNVTLFTIYKDRYGILWLGTHTAGAYRFNGKTFERFRLPSH